MRRVKYNCRSWGNWDFAVGFNAAVPVAGVGNWRDAICQLSSAKEKKAYGLLWMELGSRV